MLVIISCENTNSQGEDLLEFKLPLDEQSLPKEVPRGSDSGTGLLASAFS